MGFFFTLVHGGGVSEKSLGVSTLQAAEPPYSVNKSNKRNLENIGKWRVIYKLGQNLRKTLTKNWKHFH